MKLITSVKEMQRYVRHNYRKWRTIGLVPTMGYFHDGHVMLIREARKRCDRLVVSIFVNPLQFGRGEDFATYPRNMKRDLAIARENKVNVVFAPSSEELYPAGYSTFVEEERLSKKLCGPFRPGHFKGVTTIVAKLFNIVKPHVAVFGQKDAQQALIVGKMIRDLNYPIRLVVIPTIRERDGLACSSRNKYLSARERKEAAVIYRSLKKAEEMVRTGVRSSRKLSDAMREVVSTAPLARVEYIRIVDPESLEPVRQITGKTLIAAAVRVGKARLIDNIYVEP
jgi:pantoate--beta-alanine ligase